jgi:hypothetical protein
MVHLEQLLALISIITKCKKYNALILVMIQRKMVYPNQVVVLILIMI